MISFTNSLFIITLITYDKKNLERKLWAYWVQDFYGNRIKSWQYNRPLNIDAVMMFIMNKEK